MPLIAGQLGAGRREDADRTASALLTWALAVLVPLSALLALAAPWLSELLLGDDDRARQPPTLGTTMLLVFAPQVALYGVGHRAGRGPPGAPPVPRRGAGPPAVQPGRHRRLPRLPLRGRAGAPPPPTSPAPGDLGRWPAAPRSGVVVLSLPLLVPVARAGVRLRPTFSFPEGVARRAGALAGAGVAGAASPSRPRSRPRCGSPTRPRTVDTGVVNVYAYVQAVYLLPYAVLAVPIATSAFPALAHSTAVEELQDRSGTAARDTLASALRGILLLTAGAVTVLMAVSRPVGVFFDSFDRGADAGGEPPWPPSPAPCRPTPRDSSGFSVAALLTRALYVRGRPLHAALAVAAGLGPGGPDPHRPDPGGLGRGHHPRRARASARPSG